MHFKIIPFFGRALTTMLAFSLTHGVVRAANEGEEKRHPVRVIVKIRSEVASGLSPSMILSNHGLREVVGFRALPGIFVGEIGETYAAQAVSRAAVIANAIEELRRSGLYEYVEPDYPLFLDSAPTDSAFADGSLWNLANYGQNGGVAGMDIDAVRAWDITTGSRAVVVAVIDSGIRYTHRDLVDLIWRNPDEIQGNGIDDDSNDYVDDIAGADMVARSGDPMDWFGHGTAVAGIIGASANNGYPGVGVCWNVSLMGINIFARDSESGAVRATTSDALRGIDYAVSEGARIINASWGGAGRSLALEEAIDIAGQRGVVFVCAAGNWIPGFDIDLVPQYPAALGLDSVISVAAMDRQGAVPIFSMFGGAGVDIAAPGDDIWTCAFDSDEAYGRVSGTSAAAPHVAGILALLLARDPNLNIMQLRDRVLGGSIPMAGMRGKTVTGGRASAYGALAAHADGELEMRIEPSDGATVFAGRALKVEVRVSDLDGVLGAGVSVRLGNGSPQSFSDDGHAPDRKAGDGIYTGAFPVAATDSALSLDIEAQRDGFLPVRKQVAYKTVAVPENDNFAERTELPSEEQVVREYSNVGATGEEGEPVPEGDEDPTGGSSVWWRWRAPRSGQLVVSSIGNLNAVPGLSSAIGVYQGESFSEMVELGSGGDDSSDRFVLKQVVVEVDGDSEYQIVTGGTSGETGYSILGLAMRPQNDDFASRKEIIGNRAQIHARVSAATGEELEKIRWPLFPGQTVWWRWKAPADGVLRVEIKNHEYPRGLLRVLAGDSLELLEELAGDFDGEVFSRNTEVILPVVGGSDLAIQVDWSAAREAHYLENAEFDLVLDFSPLALTPSQPTAEAGQEFFLEAGPEGMAGVSYRWQLNGVDIPGATERRLRLPSAQAYHQGEYRCIVRAANGWEIASPPFALHVQGPPASEARVVNFSTRAQGGAGDRVLIPGFWISGVGAKKLLLRAVGPELAGFGVSDYLPDPQLALHSQNPEGVLLSNDDWQQNTNWEAIRDTGNSVFAFPLGDASKSAAVLVELPPGGYSAVVSDSQGRTGVGLVEIYEVDAEGAARVVNVSHRGFVGAGDAVMIPGFVVSSEGSRTFLVRAVGPGLAQFGVGDFLADPQIEIFRLGSPGDPTGNERILLNDNWGENGDGGAIQEVTRNLSAFPLELGSADAALAVTLRPGLYTLHARGKDGSTGVALVEVYLAP